MTTSSFLRCYPHTGLAEGGYSTDRKDPGNWSTGKVGRGDFIGTKYGISAPVLIARRAPRKVTAEDMKALTPAEAKTIAYVQYWVPSRAEELPLGLDLLVFDMGFNAGVSAAVRILQRLVGVKPDGVIGELTLAAVHDHGDVKGLIRLYSDARIRYYRRLRTWRVHGAGWTARTNTLRDVALRMAAHQSKNVIPVKDKSPLPAPAPPAETSVAAVLKTPEGLAAVAAPVATVFGAIDGNSPIGWAIAACVIVAAVVIAWRLVRKEREA